MFAYVAQPRLAPGLRRRPRSLIPLLLFLPVRWAIGVVSQACGAPAAVGRWRRPRRSACSPSAGAQRARRRPVLRRADRSRRHARRSPARCRRVRARGIGALAPRHARRRPSIAVGPRPRAWSRRGAALRRVLRRHQLGAARVPGRRWLPLARNLAAAISETGRSVVTATVESTTFGGESWLAHISLLSGTEVARCRSSTGG